MELSLKEKQNNDDFPSVTGGKTQRYRSASAPYLQALPPQCFLPDKGDFDGTSVKIFL